MKHKNTIFVPTLMLVVSLLLAFGEKLLSAVRQASSNVFFAVSIVWFLVVLLPIAFYCGLTRHSFTGVVPLRLPAWRDVPFVFFVAIAYLFGAATIKYLSVAFFSVQAAATSSLISTPLYTVSNLPLTILCFILLPAVLEQMLFSGLVLSEYREYGEIISIGMSALMFAIAHGSFEGFVFYLFTGFCMALVTRISSSILPAVLIASVAAAFDLYYETLFFEYVSQVETGSILFYFFCALFLLFSFFAVSYLERSYARRARSVKESALVALEEAHRKGALADEKKEEHPDKLREPSLRGKKESDAAKRELSFGAKLRFVFLSPVFILLIALFLLRASGVL